MVRNSMDIREFQSRIYNYYNQHGRTFPWRTTNDPYEILVSEIMLQQTQTHRVLPKYEEFLCRFPTAQDLAVAPLQEVLAYWQGLGYNRRALMLQKAAQMVCERFDGFFPDDPETLLTLPGVGPYTSCAVAAFAFDVASVFIETNIRTVYLHHFFEDEDQVKDAQIFPLIDQTLDRNNPRQWYYALMDYGVMLKKEYGNANRRSAHYAKQSKFVGSDRQIRGEIIRLLTAHKPLELDCLAGQFETEVSRVQDILDKLVRDGLLASSNGSYHIT